MSGNILIYIIILILTITITVIVFALLAFKKIHYKKEINYSLNLALLLVKVPLHKTKDATIEEIRQLISIMEQFYASIAQVKEGWLEGMFQGSSALGFELVLPAKGDEVHFYLAVPRAYVTTVEKQITGFLNGAHVEQTKDYNMFNPVGVNVASHLLLSKSFFFPIKTYKELEIDPLGFITSAMSKLEFDGEGCAVQVMVRPNKTWQESIQKIIGQMRQGKTFTEASSELNKNIISSIVESLHTKPKDQSELEKRAHIPIIDEATIKMLEQKTSKVGFDVNIRLIASALTQTRASAILSGLENAFLQFENPNFNSFVIKRVVGNNLRKLLYNFSFRNFNPAQRMILNTQELTSVFHFPTPYLDTKQIKSLKARTASLPNNMSKDGLILGKNIHQGEEKEARMGKEDRRRHLYIIGQTGTGKSLSMQNTILQDIENGEGVCLIDPHGDTIENILENMPKHRADDVIIFNPGDLERPIGLNMLEHDPNFPEQKTFIVNEMINIFDKLYDLKSTGGPMFEQYARYALLLVMEDPESGSTLLEVPRIFSDPAFRKMKLSRTKDILVKNFWEKEAEKAGGDASIANITPYITSKFNTFIANEFMRPIIAQEKSSLNFRDIMDKKKIFLVQLSKGKIGEMNSSLLGMIIVGKLLMAALSRTDTPQEERTDFYLYIDEFQNFTTDSISTILSEARKYRLSLTVAHQFIAQLDEPIKNAIFGNVGSMMIFRTGVDDAEFLQKQLDPDFNANDIINLDNLNAYVKLLVNNLTAKPFNVTIDIPKKGNPEIAKIIKELSQLKYGTDRKQIEMQIQDRFKPIPPIRKVNQDIS